MPINKECIEEIDSEACEKLFLSKYQRKEDGRYVVPLPWKTESLKLGNSYNNALRCFLALEKRFMKNQPHKELSDQFMKEYLSLGHMSPVPREMHQIRDGRVYYIPFHSVVKQDSLTTKLRNVFNASAKSSNGVSLNQLIHVGPKLQTTIFDIIVRIRQFQYIYSSDITKMYRQIELLDDDRNKLRILYRDNPNKPLEEYTLNTVTYGIDCASWQAIRTIHQVAADHASNDEISWILKNAFYMDDLFHGGDTLEECRHQMYHINRCLSSAKLPLTKWVSNDPDVLREIEPSRKLDSYMDLKSESAMIKTLGIRYFPRTDLFGFHIKKFTNLKFTKRYLLS